MIKNNILYKNKWTLTLHNKKAEQAFNSFLQEQRINYNKWYSIFLLVMNLGDIIFQNMEINRTMKNIPNRVYILLSFSYIVTILSFILLPLAFIINNKNFQIFISYFNYIILLFPFTDIREFLSHLEHSDEKIFALLRTFEVLVKMTMITLCLVCFSHGLYMNLLLLLFSVIYHCLIQEYLSIAFYSLGIIIEILISYYYTKTIKERFVAQLQVEDQMNWYYNLFEHLTSKFVSFNNENKITILNNSLLETLYKNKKIKTFLKQDESKSEEEQYKALPNRVPYKLSTNLKTEESVMNMEILKNNSEKVLEILLDDIYNASERESREFLNHMQTKIPFNLKYFMNENKNLYVNRTMDEKFLFIGYKDLEIEACSEFHDNFVKEKKILILEVFFRCRNIENTKEGEEFEIIFNDVSNIKKAEEKNAELKYKTMFLSKVAHEFKNPLICISEIVSNFNENYSQEFENSNNPKLRESFKHLKQITSFADYLLILMKDLDFYSRLQIHQELPIFNTVVDINEILESCNKMADILLLKFNKEKNVQFFLENNILDRITLITDGIKLKQVLINLISNAIKSTNSGEIKLKLDQIKNGENFIKFELSDTGVGMTDQQLQNLNQPFKKASGCDDKYGSGLGMYIVNQILKQLKSEMTIVSKVGDGTRISFCLSCQIEKEIDNLNESIMTINISDRPVDNLLISERDRTKIIVKEEEEEEEESICFKNKIPCNSHELQINLEMKPKTVGQSQIESKYDPCCSYFICVDDEKFTLSSSVKVLNKVALKINKKIQVFEAEDGIECLYLIYNLVKNGFKITAIVSDELMNYMNGTASAEILKKIKNLNTCRIPFFLLTAYPEIKNNFIDFLLSKPLNAKDAEIILNSNLIV